MYSCLGQLATKLLHLLGKEAASPGGVTRALFVAGPLQEFSIGFYRSNVVLCHESVGMLARASVLCYQAGMTLQLHITYVVYINA
jgi:predicted patatin/cPLA2 family phospholipase